MFLNKCQLVLQAMPDDRTGEPQGRPLAAYLSSERENHLQRLKARYVPPNYLRKHHKEKIMLIKSLEQGYDGKTALCCLCGKLGTCSGTGKMDIHHFNHKIADNRLENVGPAHGNCNDDENAAYRAKQRAAYVSGRVSDLGLESARTSPEGGQARQDGQAAAYQTTFTDEIAFSNKEGAKGEEMRAAWNKAIRNLETGFFARQKVWYIRALAKAAPWWLGENGNNLGSSKTYRTYIDEDILGGILEDGYDDHNRRTVQLGSKIRPKTEST